MIIDNLIHIEGVRVWMSFLIKDADCLTVKGKGGNDQNGYKGRQGVAVRACFDFIEHGTSLSSF